MTYWWTFITDSVNSRGAATHPRRQPVIAYALLKPPSSTVRPCAPGNEAKQVCVPP